MLLAGEAAGRWALERRLPFPYVSQETGDLPAEPLDGLAGAFQLRRCMRPRTLTVKPSLHWGLGLDIYSQVTSPLRRYTDLLAHQQIRAALAAESGTQAEPPIGEDDLAARLAQAERGAQAAAHAERDSRLYWTAVHLATALEAAKAAGEEIRREGILVEKRGQHGIFIVPSLGLELITPLPHASPPDLNAVLPLTLSRVNISAPTMVWRV